MTTLHLVGLDLSLTRTGWATIRPGEDIRHGVITSPSLAGPPSEYYPQTLARVRRIVARIIVTTRADRQPGDPMVVAIEGPAMGTTREKAGQADARAGLRWLTYHLLEKEAEAVVTVPPASLKRYLTGKGGGKDADKPAVVAAVQRAYPGRLITDDNEADALGLASMLARQLNQGQEASVQRVHPAALDAVHWPGWIRDLH